MNRADAKGWLRDGNSSFSGGTDGGRPPSDIDRDQVEFAINCTMRGGPIKPRPGWFKHALDFGEDHLLELAFTGGFFQEAGFYDGNGIPALLSSHGGRQFRIDLESLAVREITPTKGHTTETSAAFVIPAAAATVVVAVVNNSQMSLEFPNVTIGAYPFVLTAIDISGTAITVQNDTAANAGVNVADPADVVYTTRDVNNPKNTLAWSIQADQWWILQDNESLPLIWNGSKAVRSDPKTKQVPVGNVMAYAQGRLIVALPDRRTYRVGDLIFGSSGSAVYSYRDAVLYFTENDFLNEGGDFSARVFGAPSDSGDILAIRACAQTDAQLGQGSVLVGTPNVIFSLNLPFDRTTWKNLANALQTANPIVGPVGQGSMVSINTDMWYRAPDGIRSWRMAQRQFNGSWGNTPLSSEVDSILAFDSKELLEHGSAVFFDNRLLMTISPQMTDHGVYHRGLVVMDMDLSSSLRKQLAPAWEGVWTGLRILKILTAKIKGKTRCFMFVLNDTSEIELWELSERDKSDRSGDTEIAISGEFWLPSYSCGDLDRFKVLETGRILVSAISGIWGVVVEYRTDENPCWTPWFSKSLCAINADCGPWSTAVATTSAPFTIPAAGNSVLVHVTSSTLFSLAFPQIAIGGYGFMLTAIGSGTITVLNQLSASGTVIPSGSQVAVSLCETLKVYEDQPRRPVRLPQPPDTFNDISHTSNRAGYEFQPRIKFTGYGVIKQFRIWAQDGREMLGVDRMDET